MGILLRRDPWVFDPSSFWVIRAPYAKRVGPWRNAGSIWRTPLRDWLLRAWRLGGRFCFGTRVTGLRFLTRTEPAGAPVYATATPEHESTADRLERETPDAIRAFVRGQLRHGIDAQGTRLPREDDRERPRWQQALGACRRRVSSALYLRFGLDPPALVGRLKGRRGALLQRLSLKRTGEPLPAAPTLAAFLRDPEAHRVL